MASIGTHLSTRVEAVTIVVTLMVALFVSKPRLNSSMHSIKTPGVIPVRLSAGAPRNPSKDVPFLHSPVNNAKLQMCFGYCYQIGLVVALCCGIIQPSFCDNAERGVVPSVASLGPCQRLDGLQDQTFGLALCWHIWYVGLVLSLWPRVTPPSCEVSA